MPEADRPFITLSYAQTLDGRLATRSGSSQWISGPESLRVAHELRVAHDAIMVGIGTVLHDNPRLTVRLVPGHDPLRVIVDSSLRIPMTAAVLTDGAAAGTLLAVTARAPIERRQLAEALGATILIVQADARGQVDLPALLHDLRTRGIRSLMVEGGAQLITALLRAKLVDRLAICIAPKVLGLGIEAVGDLGINELEHALQLHDMRFNQLGADLFVDARLGYSGHASGG